MANETVSPSDVPEIPISEAPVPNEGGPKTSEQDRIAIGIEGRKIQARDLLANNTPRSVTSAVLGRFQRHLTDSEFKQEPSADDLIREVRTYWGAYNAVQGRRAYYNDTNLIEAALTAVMLLPKDVSADQFEQLQELNRRTMTEVVNSRLVSTVCYPWQGEFPFDDPNLSTSRDPEEVAKKLTNDMYHMKLANFGGLDIGKVLSVIETTRYFLVADMVRTMNQRLELQEVMNSIGFEEERAREWIERQREVYYEPWINGFCAAWGIERSELEAKSEEVLSWGDSIRKRNQEWQDDFDFGEGELSEFPHII